MRHASIIPLILLFAFPAAAQMRRRAAPPVGWTRLLIPFDGQAIGSIPSSIIAEYALRNAGDQPLRIVDAPPPCAMELCLPPLTYERELPPGTTLIDYGSYFPGGIIVNLDPRRADDLRVSLRVKALYTRSQPIGPSEGPFTGPEIPIAWERDFKTSIRLLSVSPDLQTVLRVYSLDGTPTVTVRLSAIRVAGADLSGFATATELGRFTMHLRPPRYFGPFTVEPGLAEQELTADFAPLLKTIEKQRLVIEIDSLTPIWAMAVQVQPDRRLVTFVHEQ